MLLNSIENRIEIANIFVKLVNIHNWVTGLADADEIIIPIGAVYLLDPSGIPLFARYYQGEIDKTDSTLLGGFFSAIEIFVKTSLDGILSDIGMTNSRFFFDRTPTDHIIVIIVFTEDRDFIDKSTLNIVRNLQDVIKWCFQTLATTSEESLIPLQVLIENLGTTIDSFILESSLEFLDPDNIDADYFDSIKSESLSDEKMDYIIETIRKNS